MIVFNFSWKRDNMMMVRKYLKKKEKRKRHSAIKYNNMKQNWISYYNNFF